jgi:hypothetical protein
MQNPADPWKLIWGQPYIDAKRLAAALVEDLHRNSIPEFRTRLLIRDAALAIRSYWGPRKFSQWLRKNPVAHTINSILKEDLGKTGFPSIRRRLVTPPEEAPVRQIFSLLGKEVVGRIEVNVAGSIPTLLSGLTVRPTADIDLVDEVPAVIRKQRALLQRIKNTYGLAIGHVQSHYLPLNWQARHHFLDDFGGLRVYLVDAYDIFVSKLSSKVPKHQDDLRVLATKLDKNIARKRLLEFGQAFLSDVSLAKRIADNWQFLFQEPLIPQQTVQPSAKAKPAKPRRRRPK